MNATDYALIIEGLIAVSIAIVIAITVIIISGREQRKPK